MSKDIEHMSTEERIKHAARKVFTQHGYAATKTRDIAQEAGINVASLHYYFRCKERLYEIIVHEAVDDFNQVIATTLQSDLPLHLKIVGFVDGYIDFLKENAFVPIFLMAESHKNPERVAALLDKGRAIEQISAEVNALVEAGKMRAISPIQLLINMVSLTVFPFIQKPLLQHKLEINNDNFNQLMDDRRAVICDLLINYCYIDIPDWRSDLKKQKN